MAYKRPADREVDRGAQQQPKWPSTTLAPETRKPGARDGIDKPVPDTHGTDAGGQFDPS